MKTFRQYLEMMENKDLYRSLIPPQLMAKRNRLSKMVDDAYKRGDQRNAERLDAELEELQDKIDSMLEDMDDSDGEDINTGDTGGEESSLDKDWSVQEEMARIYARYVAGDLELDDTEIVNVEDPESARKNGVEVRQMIDSGGGPSQNFYKYEPITKQKSFAKMLRAAIWESPNLSLSRPKAEQIKSMTDEQIISAAKDAYEWKMNLRNSRPRS